jgi:hypothetical protein
VVVPANWRNPMPGQLQSNVNPLSLLPSRDDLLQVRLDVQKALMDAGSERHTPIQVTAAGVIWDGHHAIRIAAERGIDVTVKVVKQQVNPTAASIMDLPVR